ncbi:MAG: Uncharacterized protein XD49_1291 [Caldanaerobacter subterraneus]|uniref:Uncharacterized protein n=1 Tax=Caldanaerobacter subterraneus subsp. tengcongensis (strain DSM 15242 / JCM 11007 / NBRC 100824 / MB4) TaxID=273068 RepID=Q8RBY2_CALS4|nr:hypothetical protein [Caldanaerobacter subterraneus]AAM23938.1 hypothetical protein TTE0674 [Caldanaerobacter subterraneus subsp. tengcongensis MB4]KUK08674.1 MAG: Uncharacterized protein XD49_1291 [Caldanaerobacter subterraneus]MCS3916550.1 hypothetical protein [Caldanaerobacter subterraneus subsp. tengcongensis MB4]
MNIYDKINAVINCDDLLTWGELLIDFAESALKEKNRAKIVKFFYQQLQYFGLLDYVFDSIINKNDSQYLIYEGIDAVRKYVALTIPKQDTPVKTLKSIKTYGNQILSDFKKPVGKRITKEKIEEIMHYLDEKFSFSKKVFADRKPMFILLNYSHRKYNSECLVMPYGKEIIQHFFLYNMKSNLEDTPAPEAVFFHELGHALHARYTENVKVVPEEIILFLKELCMPKIDLLEPEQQREVFADILSIGMMYDNPFSEYDPFVKIREDDKKVFRMLVEKILDSI